MLSQEIHQLTIEFLESEIHLESQITAFLVDRKAQQLSPKKIEFYRQMLRLFNHYCQSQAV